MMGTVHLIDDDASLRAALGRLLAAAGYQVRAYAAAGDYLLPEPGRGPACLVLDLHLAGASGLDLQAALRRHPDYQRPVIFLSGTADVRSSVRAMNAGARDFLTKPVDGGVLLAAVKDAIAHDARECAVRDLERRARHRVDSLRSRERKVVEGVAAGRLHKQLAAELGVSERTIKADRARAMARLEVRALPALLRLLEQARDPVPPDTIPLQEPCP